MSKFFLFSTMAGCLFLVGCGEPTKTAADGLKERGYGQTVGDYLLAAEAGDLVALRLFHESGMAADAADESGNTALMRAAAGGQVEVLEILLKAGADAKAKNTAGRTPLMFAAESGREEAIRSLLSHGADIKAQDQEGWSALKLAAFHGRAGATDLLAGRVDQSELDRVLLLASMQGEPTVVGHLLTHGAYVNTRNPENLTPLMIAAQAGHGEAVKVLLRNQANPFALDDHEHTAANLAEASGHLELRDLLLDPSAIFEIAEAAAAKDSATATPAGEPKSAEAQAAAEEAIMKTLGALVGETATPMAAATSASGGAKSTAPGSADGNTPVAAAAAGAAGSAREVSSIVGRTLTKAIGEPAGTGVVESLKLKNYREAPLPVMLKSVESASGSAKVRVLSRADSAPIEVRKGDLIPGTTLRVASVDSKQISSKLGNGHLIDVSRILVEDTRSGTKHLLIKDVPGRSNQTYATLTLPGSTHEYVVKNGDTFRAMTADDKEQDFEVLDVRPTQVVIRNVSTEEVLTVNREGLAMR
jgi:ankyrin repeat protein